MFLRLARTPAHGRVVWRPASPRAGLALCCAALLSVLAACGTAPPVAAVRPDLAAPAVPPLTPAQVEAVGTLALARVIRPAEAVSGGYRADAGCLGPARPPGVSGGRRDLGPDLAEAFTRTLGDALGFVVARSVRDDVFARPNFAHPTFAHPGGGTAEAEAEFLLGARLTRLHYDLCAVTGPHGLPAGTIGTAEGDFVFQVLDRKSGQVVHDGRVSAAGTVGAPIPGRPEPVLLARLFESALMRLAADNGFRRAVVSGLPARDALRGLDVDGRAVPLAAGSFSVAPPSVPTWPAVAAAPVLPSGPGHGAGASQGTPGVGMMPGGTILGPPLYLEPMALNIERIRAATVTILGMDRHGSGFFLSEDGWLLTTNHVVADADVFRVRLADGRQPWARVERRHPGRDVALLKVIGRGFFALPLRPTLARVSETAYAIGTPARRDLGQSVSEGIISAWRPGGHGGYDVYQATTPVYAGNSGGPLVDAWGNVVAVAVAGITDGAQGPGTGLGFFIPIHDALAVLNLRVETPRPAPGPALASW